MSRVSIWRAWLGIEFCPRIGRWNSWPSGQSRTFCVIRLGGFGNSAVTMPSPETRQALIDAWRAAFPDHPKVMLIGDDDGMRHAVSHGQDLARGIGAVPSHVDGIRVEVNAGSG